jgi:thiamine-phosphate pyrophosphorylase
MAGNNNKKFLNEGLMAPSNHRAESISGLYTIVDSGFNPFDSLATLARRYLEGGARIVQLRMKTVDASGSPKSEVRSPTSDFRRNAEEIMKLKREFDFTFIVNDYADIALEVGADGVHVGENDEPVERLRARVGEKLLIGYSSHSREEAVEAERCGADYVAFGAIFPTPTKGPGHPVQGLRRLREVASAVNVPLVAIGGIVRENVRGVLAAGADAVAMITALARAENVVAETKWFTDAISGCVAGE